MGVCGGLGWRGGRLAGGDGWPRPLGIPGRDVGGWGWPERTHHVHQLRAIRCGARPERKDFFAGVRNLERKREREKENESNQ